jgi:DNA-binding protein H-NS
MASGTSIDLDAMSVRQLTDLIQAAEAKRQEKSRSERTALLQEVTRKAEDLGLTIEELLGVGAAKPAAPTRRGANTKKVSAKYRGPNGEEWTGRGRMPKWLSALQAEGKKREDFLIR